MIFSSKLTFLSALSLLSLTCSSSYGMNSQEIIQKQRSVLSNLIHSSLTSTEFDSSIIGLLKYCTNDFINKQDERGNTVLHYVIMNSSQSKREALVKQLLERGVLLTIKNDDGKTALDLAFQKDLTGLGKVIFDWAWQNNRSDSLVQSVKRRRITDGKTLNDSVDNTFIDAVNSEDKQTITDIWPLINDWTRRKALIKLVTTCKRDMLIFLLQQPSSSSDDLTEVLNNTINTILLMNSSFIQQVLSLAYFNESHLQQLCEYFLRHNKISALIYLIKLKPLRSQALSNILCYVANKAISYNKIEVLKYVLGLNSLQPKLLDEILVTACLSAIFQNQIEFLKYLLGLDSLQPQSLDTVLVAGCKHTILKNQIDFFNYLLGLKSLQPKLLEDILTCAFANNKFEFAESIAKITPSSEIIDKAFTDLYLSYKIESTNIKNRELFFSKVANKSLVINKTLGLVLIAQNKTALDELLSFGAKIEAVDPEVFNQALNVALEKNNKEFIEKLVSYMPQLILVPQDTKDTLLLYAITHDNILLTEQALQCGAYFTKVQEYLISFIQFNNYDGFNKAIEQIIACLKPDNYNAFNKALKYSINPYSSSSFIDKALRRACSVGLKNTATCLLELGANIHCADLRGNPDAPIKMAASAGHTELVELLIAYGADSNAFNDARTFAAKNGHTDTANLLDANLLLNLSPMKLH